MHALRAPLARRSFSLARECDSLQRWWAAPAAETLLGAWSTEAADAAPVEVEDQPPVESLDDVFGMHDALRASPQADRLGGFGGYKLGWKGHPLLTDGRAAMYSPIFAGCFRPSGSAISLSRHKVFCAEAEFAFHMARGLPPRDAPYSPAEVWAAVGHVELAIELCGARAAAPTSAGVTPYHLLADAMLNALVVRGPVILRNDGTEAAARAVAALADVPVRLLVGGVEISSGSGRENPLDTPLGALTFLVNDLTYHRRRPLEAHALVIAGHCCQVAFAGRPAPATASAFPQASACGLPDAKVGRRARAQLSAHFGGLGSVEAALLE